MQRWGEPRFTADADLSVLVEPGDEASVIQALLHELPARIDDAAGFAARTRVVLLRSEQGVGIDIVLAGLPFEARVIIDPARGGWMPKMKLGLAEELEKRIKRHLGR